MRVLCDFARKDPDIAWYARGELDQEKLAHALILYASKDESQAEVVLECISPDRKGFWPIAMEIAARYPKSEMIRKQLAVNRLFGRSSRSGSESEYYERHRIQVEQLLNDGSTPESVRGWLRALAQNLRQKASECRVSEVDEDLGSL